MIRSSPARFAVAATNTCRRPAYREGALDPPFRLLHRSSLPATTMQLQLALVSLPLLAPPAACSFTQDKNPEAGSIGRVVSKIDQSALIVFQDQRDRYWFGSDGEGVFCYDGRTITQYSTKDGLCHDHVRSIQEDGQGSLYVTTTNGI